LQKTERRKPGVRRPSQEDGNWTSRFRFDSRGTYLLFEELLFWNKRKLKPDAINLSGSSKEGCGSRRTVLSMMILMTIL
jgi:hypothetical protein